MRVPLGFDVVLHAASGGGSSGRIDGGVSGWGGAGALGALEAPKKLIQEWSAETLPAKILGVPTVELPEIATTWTQRIAVATVFAITIRLIVDKVWKSKRFKRTFKVR